MRSELYKFRCNEKKTNSQIIMQTVADLNFAICKSKVNTDWQKICKSYPTIVNIYFNTSLKVHLTYIR